MCFVVLAVVATVRREYAHDFGEFDSGPNLGAGISQIAGGLSGNIKGGEQAAGWRNAGRWRRLGAASLVLSKGTGFVY